MWSAFSSIKDVMNKSIKEKGLGPKVEVTLILAEFDVIAKKIWDKQVAEDMKALYVKNKILNVAVLNSILAQEIKMREQLILAELKKKFGAHKVIGIRVVI